MSDRKNPAPGEYVLTRLNIPRLAIQDRCYIAREPLEELGTVYTTRLAEARRWRLYSSARSYLRFHNKRCAQFAIVNVTRQGHLLPA